MELERSQTLCARPAARAPSFHPSLQSRGIPMAPPEMLVERKEDTRSRRFIAVWKPELVIAFLICGDGVQAISRQFAEDGQRSRIRQRSSREAVRGSTDNQRGREALRPPHRMRDHCRCRRVGWETPTPSGARVGRWLPSSSCRRRRSPSTLLRSPADIVRCGGETRSSRHHDRGGPIHSQIVMIASLEAAPCCFPPSPVFGNDSCTGALGRAATQIIGMRNDRRPSNHELHV